MSKKDVSVCPVCSKNLKVVRASAKVVTEEHTFCSASCHQISLAPSSFFQPSRVFGRGGSSYRSRELKVS